MLPRTCSVFGSSVGTALRGLWGFPALPLGRDLSSPGGVGWPQVGVQLLVCG